MTLNRPIDADVWAAVKIEELDGRDLDATVAFSAQVDLAAFLDRLGQYRAASPAAKGHLVGADLFDPIDSVRFYGPADRVTPRLDERLVFADPDALHNVDIEIWHPGSADDADEAEAWVQVVREALTSADGSVLDWSTNHEIGVQLLRVRASTVAIRALAELDEIASIDLKPSVPEIVREATRLTVADLPAVRPPAADAPLFAIIDSGVSGAHPLIGPALYEATTLLPDLPDGADEVGHGTAVAGLALHGPTETGLMNGITTPVARLLSIRVLNVHNEFPDEQLWANAVIEAVEHAAARGCRIINLSIGDRDAAMVDRRATRVAAMLDEAARRLGVVLVVPTGNIDDLREYIAPSPSSHLEYIDALARSSATTLLDPAPAALALTVGGLGASGMLLRLGERAMGGDQQPSAASRRGPGIARAVKPEVVAPAGTVAWTDTLGFVDRPAALKPLVLSHEPDLLFSRSRGTSFAAPLVTRVATAIQAAYPSFSAPLIRALVLQSCQPVAIDQALLPAGKPAERQRHQLNLVGHGVPTFDGARYSRQDRVVLVDEGKLEVDQVRIYEVPLPESFFKTGGTRTIDLAVCFDPLTRYRRKDYLGSRLFPYLFVGRTPQEILEVLAESDIEDLVAGPHDEEVEIEDDDDASARGLRSLRPIKFRPSTAVSSDSANIFMRAVRQQRFDPALPRVAHLAIRSTRQWAQVGTRDPFGIALALGHDLDDIDLYQEIRARVEIEIEVEELELEVQA